MNAQAKGGGKPMRADTNKEIQEEMVGVLTAISIVSKRLASRLLQLDTAEKPKEEDAADEQSQSNGEKERVDR